MRNACAPLLELNLRDVLLRAVVLAFQGVIYFFRDGILAPSMNCQWLTCGIFSQIQVQGSTEHGCAAYLRSGEGGGRR